MAVDQALVRRLREEVADVLARQRRDDAAAGVAQMSGQDERQFARAVVNRVLDAYARAEIAAGRTPPSPVEESELASGMPQFPQVLLNVKVREPVDPTRNAAVREAVGRVESELGKRGRVVLRASGTEPVIRVMVEGEDEQQVHALAGRLAESVKSSFGG